MAKKILIFMMILMLSFAGSHSVVYASDPPIGQLENQGETESTAGITWDQINEMAQNSPNSLTPIQGLVLWMFAILAFLKLAQKMDSLLQSLGLNVTQTGGRAVGDLIMAGMALKNIGGIMSKGMGMFGFGRGGGSGSGTSGTGGGTSTGSAGGTGPTPIPTGSPGGGPTPRGGFPGGSSSSGTSPSSAPAGGSSTSGMPSGSTPPSVGTPSGSTPPTNPTSTAGTSGAESTGQPINSRNPIGRATEWMRSDGFAQGAVRAGAKGGLIGVGAYTTKAGASKIGAAVSARLGGSSISSSPYGEVPNDNNSNTQNTQQPVDSNINNNDTTQGVYNGENPENYQTSRPLDGTKDQASIPTSVNSEDYQDSMSSDNADGSDADYSSVNTEDYNEIGTSDITADARPIPTTINHDDNHDSEMESGESTATVSTAHTDDEVWQDTKPVDSAIGTVPIPTTVNNEAWQDSNPIPISQSQQEGGENATKPITSAPQDAAAIQNPGTVTQAGATAVVTAAPDSPQVQQGAVIMAQSNTSAIIDSSSVTSESVSTATSVASSESVSTVHASSSEHESGMGHSVSYGGDSPSVVNEGNVQSYESAPMPLHNPTIPSDFPQSAAPSGLSQDAFANDSANTSIAVLDSMSHTPIQSDNAAITTSTPPAVPTPSSDVVHPTQAHVVSETIRTEIPATAQTQGTVVTTGDPASSAIENTTVQSQTTQINNASNPDSTKQVQNTAQNTTQVMSVEKQGHGTQPTAQPATVKGDTSSRPTAKGKSKNPSVKGSKRRR